MRGIPVCFNLLVLLVLPFLSAAGCPTPEVGNGGCGSDESAIDEVEPNDTMATAQTTGLADTRAVCLQGRIDPQGDLDLYDLGPLSPGDRITVDVNTSQTEVDLTALLIEANAGNTFGVLVAVNDDPTGDRAGIDPSIDVVIRHPVARCLLVLKPSFTKLLQVGPYTARVTVVSGGSVPSLQRQPLLLDFDGGTASGRSGQTVAMEPFDAAAIDPFYAGQTQAIKDAIVATVRENFAGFNLDITSTDEGGPPAGSFSALFVGQSEAADTIAGSEGMGMALDGVDAGNTNHGDQAVVLADRFQPATFGVLEPISPAAMGVAIGNVASHEVGHLLGLNHAIDPASVMNTFDAPEDLQMDQRFKTSTIHFGIFDAFQQVLIVQNEPMLLTEAVGRTAHVAHSTVNVGINPWGIAAGDLDGDGHTDLATANRLGGSVSLLWNNGHGVMGHTSELEVGTGPMFIVPLDADGDGDLDLMAATPDSPNLILLINDGRGVFTPGVEPIAAGNGPVALVAEDLDGDQDVDVAVTNSSSNMVNVLLNDGQGRFHPAGSYTVGGYPFEIAAARVDPDAAVDLVVTDLDTGQVSVLLNHGDGTFAEAVGTAAGDVPGGLTTADLDGDGDLDLAIACGMASQPAATQFVGSVAVMLNDGSGSFGPPVESLVASGAASIDSGDFDGDGDIDLVVGCTGYDFLPWEIGQVSVLLNRGDGTFAQHVAYDAGEYPRTVRVADLNGDGVPDFVVANPGSSAVRVFLNDGSGRFGVSAQVQ